MHSNKATNMTMRKIGKINAETSLLGFGAMRLALGADGAIDYETSGKMVDLAIAGGVNYFDTAYVYHNQQSEVFLGEALVSRYPRESFYLATKLPTFRVSDASELEPMLDESLRRLKTDYIDFYLLHSLRLETWEKMKAFGVAGLIDKAKKDGRIKRIGFSSHAVTGEFEKIINDYPWEFVQLQINYADWVNKPGIKDCYEIARRAGVPVIVMEPIRGGGLSNPEAPAVKAINALLAEGAAPAAAAQEAPQPATPASVALRWAAGLGGVFVILSGMSTVAQVEENLKTFAPLKPLNEKELGAIDKTIEEMKNYPTVPCTACGYCLENCPNKIPIDTLFDLFNAHLYFTNTQRFLMFYPGEGRRADNCVGCGSCSAVCPQHIDIPVELERVDSLYKSVAAPK